MSSTDNGGKVNRLSRAEHGNQLEVALTRRRDSLGSSGSMDVKSGVTADVSTTGVKRGDSSASRFSALRDTLVNKRPATLFQASALTQENKSKPVAIPRRASQSPSR